jgi:predicted dehydrogenase
MRFGVVGSDADGWSAARALVATGRHELVACTDADAPDFAPAAKRYPDLEELLADPAIELVIVAGSLSVRPEQLRRALQSERHVLCAHPADAKPETAYEAAMIQGDTKKLLLPLLTDAHHPAVVRLTDLLRSAGGRPTFISLERWLPDPGDDEDPVWLSGWDVLRRLGGEVAEVSGFAPTEEATASDPLLIAGRFEQGGTFQATVLPDMGGRRRRLTATWPGGRAELRFQPDGGAELNRTGEGGQHTETWPGWDRWAPVVEALDGASAVTWQDEVRALELDDAARRSVAKRRVSTLDYQQVSEEVGFKGTMTLVGCGLLWALLGVLLLAMWQPVLFWAIIPLLAAFLVLQLLRWVAQPPPTDRAAS